MKNINDKISYFIRSFERVLALFIILAAFVYGIMSVPDLVRMDWSQVETLIELVNRILLMSIGLELARLLISHSFTCVLELLAFVVARKTLKPDIEAIDILISVLAFVILIAAQKYFSTQSNNKNRQV